MVFYFKARPEAGDFMGLDKYDNEELIKYGFMEDIWFHVDKMASAHMVRTVRVEKRIHEIVNRLNKAKVERKPDLKADKEAVYAMEKTQRK
ncbi:hypothetical protein Gogos_021469 [Gossypium gossypioides]|uniref:NFACT RNA-binding domain-containing protein n=2 Tax=Gossypium gossypioides TaxID=34282 RepID=A0A7J9D729_GOSGO|nr:hypothetical protein [Gossypium gossypioides]